MNIKIVGYKGQGVKTAARILARAMLLSSQNAQEFSLSSDNIVTSYVRVDKNPIVEKGVFDGQDFIVVFDKSLFSVQEFKDQPVNAIIINSTEKPSSAVVKEKKIKIYSLDATSVAIAQTGKPIPNTAMLGALSKYYDKLSAKNLKSAIEQEISIKQKENQLAADEGYKAVK